LLGPVHSFSDGIRSVDVLWLEVAIVGLTLHLGVTRRWSKPRWRFELALLSLLALAPAVLVSPDQPLGVIVLYRLVMGTVGGWALASLWCWFGLDHWNPVDTGLVIAGLGTSAQLLLVLMSSNVTTYHEDASLSWAASNYVAAVLVVLGLATWGRMVKCSVRRGWIALPFAMLLMAILTFSRGEFLALAAGLAFLFLRGFATQQPWRYRRLAATLLSGAASYWVFDQITQTRLAGASAAHLQDNIQTRLDLAALSARMFVNSPLMGQGLGSLRGASLLFVNETDTYAHNIELSLLGQAGLLALPYLVLLAASFYAPFATSAVAHLRPAVVALLVISQIEPMFEGTVGGTFSWAVLFICYFAWRETKLANHELSQLAIPASRPVTLTGKPASEGPARAIAARVALDRPPRG
jgi:hypothetical protein